MQQAHTLRSPIAAGSYAHTLCISHWLQIQLAHTCCATSLSSDAAGTHFVPPMALRCSVHTCLAPPSPPDATLKHVVSPKLCQEQRSHTFRLPSAVASYTQALSAAPLLSATTVTYYAPPQGRQNHYPRTHTHTHTLTPWAPPLSSDSTVSHFAPPLCALCAPCALCDAHYALYALYATHSMRSLHACVFCIHACMLCMHSRIVKPCMLDGLLGLIRSIDY